MKVYTKMRTIDLADGTTVIGRVNYTDTAGIEVYTITGDLIWLTHEQVNGSPEIADVVDGLAA